MQAKKPRDVNSTSVRVSTWPGRALRLAFAVLNRAPGLAGLLAERLFFTPPGSARKAPPGAERVSLGNVRGAELAAWSWGSGPSVLLLHGWGGSAAQLAPLARSLAGRGFRAVALDAPAHGLSSGRLSSLPEFAETASAAARRFAPVQAVIGHSMGGAALALALGDGLRAQGAVFIATPRNPVEWTRRFADALGIGAGTLAAMKQRSERRLRIRWEELDAAAIAPRMKIPLLVVHDVEDREVAFAEGEGLAAAWPEARLMRTRGLGHNRILRDQEVNTEVAAFVAGLAPGARRDAGQAAFEQELFDRDLRWERRVSATS